MSTASLSTFFCGFFLIFAFARCCQSCHNATTDFQEMLQSLQEPERFQADGSIKLFRRTVFTKLECLDICLRTLECDSFDMKQRQSEKRKRKPWICVINRLNRRVNSESTVPDHNGKDTGWIHFPVTSQELEEVLMSAAKFCHTGEYEQELMNTYCAGKTRCNVTDTEGKCPTVWKARRASQNPVEGWCCFDPSKIDECLEPVKDP